MYKFSEGDLIATEYAGKGGFNYRVNGIEASEKSGAKYYVIQNLTSGVELRCSISNVESTCQLLEEVN